MPNHFHLVVRPAGDSDLSRKSKRGARLIETECLNEPRPLSLHRGTVRGPVLRMGLLGSMRPMGLSIAPHQEIRQFERRAA